MSTLLMTRVNRAFIIGLASMLLVSMLAPMVALASTDLVAGDSAVVTDGANLRSDTAVLDDTSILAELPAGTTVQVIENPVYNDTGVWVYVATDGFGPGWISAPLLTKVSADQPPAEPAANEKSTNTVVSDLAWLEPIDTAHVVDNNMELPTEGLAVLNGTSLEAGVLGHVHVGTTLDVTDVRVWVGDLSFVRVNFNGVGGYVDGRYVVLTSETATAEPTEEIIYIEETAAPAETEVVEVPAETEVPVETVVEAPVEETAAVDTVVEETAAVETVVEEAPVETEVATEETAVEEAPVETEVATEETVVEEAPVETEVATEETVVEEAPVETEVATEETVVEEAPVETEVATEETVVEEASAEVVATDETVVEEAPVETQAVETEVATEVPATVIPAASTQPAFDPTAMIGSATVTGTTSGLVCRSAPEAGAPVLTTLAEGTRVLVSAEAVNGYLGIDCAGLQGYADVNFLWSGGAGDGEITAAKMNVVISGTGNGLNCRTGAGTNFPVITVLFDGSAMQTRGAASNGWTPVVCGGQNGFVSTTWISVTSGGSTTPGTSTGTATSGSATVNTGGDGLYCRNGAGTSYGVITVLSHGSSVSVRGAKQGEWVPVVCGSMNGFAHGSFLNVSAAPGTSAPTAPTSPVTGTSTGRVTVANTGGQALNCRTGAGTNFPVITSLSLGSTVNTRSGSTSGWTAVLCGGQNGFVSSEFVSGAAAQPAPAPSTPTTPVTGATGTMVVNTGGDGLYCRSGAGTSFGVITVLSHGATVSTRGSATNGWVPVVCGGQNGFASGQFLSAGSTAAPAPTNPTPAPAPSGMVNGDRAKTTATVNLRYSASLSAGVSTTVASGLVVNITGPVSNGFYPVNYDGLTGFISADYLVKTSEPASKRGGSATPTQPAPAPSVPGTGTPTGSALVNYAMRYQGYPYVWATHGPSSFDCSGFTYWVVYNVTGKNIGYGTWTQVAAGTPVSRANLQPGDLVFFQNTYTAGLSHVGLYIGNNKFIHAQNEDTGVVISDLDSSYYGPRWYGAVRVN